MISRAAAPGELDGQPSHGSRALEVIQLPPLQVEGKPVAAHTQGIEVLGDDYYVTARREDVRPKRAMLLHTSKSATNWNVWDISPATSPGVATLDHPGGMQSDGRHLWIPIAESKPKSRSVIRAYPIRGLGAAKDLEFDFEFTVADHIGAVAVQTSPALLLGANWDTESVYIWDPKGNLQQTLNGGALAERGLGLLPNSEGRAGLAVQDWKLIGGRLFASGLGRALSGSEFARSHLLIFTNFLGVNFQSLEVSLPRHSQTELAREAMAVADGWIYFLPEDLSISNRLFRWAQTVR